MENKDIKSLGYKCGQLLGSAIVLCVTAVIIALTVKFLFWIF